MRSPRVSIVFIYNLSMIPFPKCSCFLRSGSKLVLRAFRRRGARLISLIQCYVNEESLASFELKLQSAHSQHCGWCDLRFVPPRRQVSKKRATTSPEEGAQRTHTLNYFFCNFICFFCLDTLSDRNIGIKVWLVIKSWWCSNLTQWSSLYTNLWTTQRKMSIYVTNISFLYGMPQRY